METSSVQLRGDTYDAARNCSRRQFLVMPRLQKKSIHMIPLLNPAIYTSLDGRTQGRGGVS